MQFQQPSPHAVVRPDEPQFDVMINDVVERVLPVAGGSDGDATDGSAATRRAPPPLRPVRQLPNKQAFPKVDPTRNYAKRSTTPTTTSSVVEDGCKSMSDERLLQQQKQQPFVANFDSDPSIPNHMLPAGQQHGAGASGQPLVLAADVELLLQQSASAAGSSGGGVPLNTVMEAAERVMLHSTVSPQRVIALSAIFSRLSSSSNGSTLLLDAREQFRNVFLFGPDCAERLFRVVESIRSGPPTEVLAAIEVLAALCYREEEEIAQAVSESSIPLADHVASRADSVFSGGDSNGHGGDEDSHAPFEDISEWLRLDLSRGLEALKVAFRVLQAAVPTAEWPSLAKHRPNITACDIRRSLWQLMSVCVCVDNVEFMAKNPYLRQEISAAIESIVSGSASLLGDYLPMFQYLRKACHHRTACMQLVGFLRPLWQLLLAVIKDDCSGTMMPSSSSSSSASEDDEMNRSRHRLVMVHIEIFLVLRSFIRHGCDSILRDFGPDMLLLIPQGSLIALELFILCDDVAEEGTGSSRNDVTMLLANAAREAFRHIFRASEERTKIKTEEEGEGGNNNTCEHLFLCHTVVQSTAMQYLATYLGMEGVRAVTMLGPPTETQMTFQQALSGSLLQAHHLAGVFPSLKARQSQTGRRLLLSSWVGAESYSLVRLLVAIVSVFPVTRDPILGFVESVAARFAELMYLPRRQNGAAASSILTTVEELSTIVEVVVVLGNEPKYAKMSRSIVGLVLQCMSVSKQCLDAAPLVANILWELLHFDNRKAVCGVAEVREKESAVQTIVQAVVGSTDVSTATKSPVPLSNWTVRTLGLGAPALCSQLVVFLLSVDSNASLVYGWQQMFADVLMWSVALRGDAKNKKKGDEGALVVSSVDAAAGAMVTLCQLAFAARGASFDDSISTYIASSVGSFDNALSECRLSLTALAGLCVGVFALGPEASLACLRLLESAHDSFGWTISDRTSTTTAASRSTAEALVSFTNIFQRRTVATAFTALRPVRSATTTASWSVHAVIEWLQAAIPLLKRTTRRSWPYEVLMALISNGDGGVPLISQHLHSDFERQAVEETLTMLGWESWIRAETEAELTQGEGSDDVAAAAQRAVEGESWDEDEFNFD